MKVEMYALLKEYFEPVVEVAGNITDTEQLKERLIALQPGAAAILSSCRFAVNDSFINSNFKLEQDHVISIIPPSSGG